MFKNLLASIGVGAARVDTQLEYDTVRAGEPIKGEVVIYGGKVPQKIDAINLFVTTRFIIADQQTYDYFDLGDYLICEPLTIQPDEERSIPFEVTLPVDVPSSVGDTDVWLETGLDIKRAADPKDQDRITVLPHRLVQMMQDAMEKLELKLYRTRNLHVFPPIETRLPFVQEYEYEPKSGPFFGKLDDMEIIAIPTEGGVDVYLEIDRKGSVVEEMSGKDIDYINFKLKEGDIKDVDQMAVYFRNVIQEHI